MGTVGVITLGARLARRSQRDQRDANEFKDLAEQLARISHGYLRARDFAIYAVRQLTDPSREESESVRAKAGMYLQLLHFRRQQSQFEEEYSEDLYYR